MMSTDTKHLRKVIQKSFLVFILLFYSNGNVFFYIDLYILDKILNDQTNLLPRWKFTLVQIGLERIPTRFTLIYFGKSLYNLADR